MSSLTEEEVERRQLTKLMVFGPTTIKVDNVLYDINELIEKRKKRLGEGEVISEAKLQVRIVQEKVKLEHIREYLSRFFDYKVQHINLAGYSWDWRLSRDEIGLSSPWGQIEITRENHYEEIYSIEEKINVEKPVLRQVFDFLTSIELEAKKTAFDNVRSMILVKKHAKKQANGRYAHAIAFGCLGDCQPTLSVTSDEKDFEEFITFFQSKGYTFNISLCTVELAPKTVSSSYTRKVPGYERREQCAVL